MKRTLILMLPCLMISVANLGRLYDDPEVYFGDRSSSLFQTGKIPRAFIDFILMKPNRVRVLFRLISQHYPTFSSRHFTLTP
ncbi:hypothetical protein BDR03DRAFT_556973 [Suillus americanus]|nr:hypothetical protein BDR03DRAFT_556973 [Suillus americanus]